MADEDDQNDGRQSEDDALQPPDDIFNPAIDEESLEEDYDTPAAPAKPHQTTPKLPPDHPATDSNLDAQELYDEGLTSATDYDAQDEAEEHDQTWPLEPEEEGYDEERNND